jgi:hypothetical protein
MKQPRPIILASLIFNLLLSLLACAPAQTAPTTPPAIRGSITSRTAGPGGDLVGSILVEGQVETDTTFDKASIAVTAKTQIFEQVGQEHRPATFDALQMGRSVEAWFDGPVAESYPVQATASDIVILEE